MNTSISLGICTYNRCASLAITLSTIVEQKSNLDQNDEIIVVDNNSSDQTKNIVESFSDQLPIRYVFEQKQGLSAARNRLLTESKGDVIIFVDDDITVYPEFINAYRRAFIKYSNIGFFGGKIDIDWCGKPLSWYRDDSLPLINGLLGHYDLGNQDLTYQLSDLLPYGANFALRSTVIKQVGTFNESLGVNGTQLGRGEETDYFMRALDACLMGKYVANARVGHRFDKTRINLRHLYSYGLAKGQSTIETDIQMPAKNITSEKSDIAFFVSQTPYCMRACFQLMKGRRDRFYQSVINLGIQHGIHIRTQSLGNKVS